MTATHQPNHVIQCRNCGAQSPETFAYCPACGALLDSSASADPAQPLALETLLDRSHQTLVKAGAEAAEYAFGISCSLGLLASGVLLVLVFLVITRAWTSLAVTALIAVLISTIIATFLAMRSRQATFRQTYHRKIRAEIDRYITDTGLEHGEFKRRAAEILPSDSPLRSFIAEDHSQI